MKKVWVIKTSHHKFYSGQQMTKRGPMCQWVNEPINALHFGYSKLDNAERTARRVGGSVMNFIIETNKDETIKFLTALGLSYEVGSDYVKYQNPENYNPVIFYFSKEGDFISLETIEH